MNVLREKEIGAQVEHIVVYNKVYRHKDRSHVSSTVAQNIISIFYIHHIANLITKIKKLPIAVF